MFSLNLRIVTSLLLIAVAPFSLAQDCNCDHFINPSNSLQVLNGSDFQYSPGDVFCMTSGTYNALRLINFKGTEENPLIFKNCGGKVVVESDTYSGIMFRESEFIRITGTGDENIEYGIHINYTSSGRVGLSVTYLSTDFEIDHLEVSNTGFAGIMAKTDPECNDPKTWRENFLMKNIIIHDNYVHDTGGEGMYVGASFGYETTKLDDCPTVFAHFLDDVKIFDNIVEDVGWDGIQVSLGVTGTEVYRNTIYGYGSEKSSNHNAGLQLGSGAAGEYYNNIIWQKPEYAIEEQTAIQAINALTGTIFYNNIIIEPGEYGIWMHLRFSDASIDMSKSYNFINNTIIAPGANSNGNYGTGIFFNTCIPSGGPCRDYIPNNFINNIIVNPGRNYDNSGFWKNAEEAFIDFNTKEIRATANRINNIYARDQASAVPFVTEDVKFVNYDGHNFEIGINSVAIDAGMDVSAYGVNFDYEYGARPVGSSYDAGAYEFGATNIAPISDAGSDASGQINVRFDLDGGNSTDSDGTITSYQWTQISGPDVTLNNPNQVQASFTPTSAGTYVFELSVTDNDGATGVDEISVTVAPSNSPPLAKAGSDINATINSVIDLDGSGSSDSDGTIVSYQWTQINGPNVTIDNADQVQASFTPQTVGTYIFRLTVTDNNGASDFDEVSVSVSEIVNMPPVANAGVDAIETVNSIISLNGSASTDPDGSINSFQWIQSNGPNVTISNSDQAVASFTPSETGLYIFGLTVTDNDNLSSSDEISIDVIENPNSFQPPKFFSPNNDGIGDFWEIDNIDMVSTCSLEVFNSNGQKVFEAQPYLNNWDGNNIPEGDYYYIFLCNGETFSSGSLRLIR